MRSFLFQDVVSLNGTTATTIVTQTDREYLDLLAYQDFTAWVEVVALSAGGAPFPTVWLETAPLKEEVLFVSPQGGTQTSVALAVGLFTAPEERHSDEGVSRRTQPPTDRGRPSGTTPWAKASGRLSGGLRDYR